MTEQFEEATFREFSANLASTIQNVIKSEEADIVGKTKITVDEEGQDGVKIILKKDDKDVVKEIKFVCSCGQTKSILLDYNE